jgi:arylsulfatase A-like enzyme
MSKLAALGALLALLAGACAYIEDDRPTGFILISIDTLRADRLGAYGYEKDTSPFFDEFAARGTLFEHAIVQLPGTLPSHMSIFTGLYPGEHGVYPPDSVLAAEIPTLPEVFRAAGYRTAGFTEGGYVAGHYGFERGFDTFRAVNTGKPGAAGRTFDLVRDWIDTLEPKDKFFLFVHTYEVHDPYLPMEGFGEDAWPGDPPDTWEPTGANLTAASLGKLPVTPETVQYFSALYDAGIRYTDEVLRDFMAHVWARDLAPDTTVVITSDHGEEFFEHGSFVHRQVYNETLHVPLLVRRLGERRGSRVAQLVESVDIAPTLLELAGLEGSMEPSGASLVPLLGGRASENDSEAFAEGVSVPTRTVYRRTDSGLFQFLLTPGRQVGGRLSPPRRELYRLDDDPLQQEDLAPRRSAMVQELERALAGYQWEARASAGQEELSDEQIERLKSLGYLQ